MRLLILGAGAVGGYFGGRLMQAGCDVTFLVRAARAEALRANGLRIKSNKGDASLTPKIVVAASEGGPYDLVLLTCKAYDLDSAMDAIAPAVGTDTAVLPTLNGMRHLDTLDARFGRGRVLGGVARIGTTLAADGTIVHTSPFTVLTMGERDKGAVPRAAMVALAAGLKAAGVDGGVHPDIVQDMWDKWMMLGTLASMTCSLRGYVGDMMAADEGEALVRETLAECRAIAVASGFPPSDRAIKMVEGTVTVKGSLFAASLLHDLEKGGRIEAGQIVGDLLARGRALGFQSPNLRFAHAHLQVYEARRAREAKAAG